MRNSLWPLALYAVLCILLFPYLENILGPDALSYISIAEFYANLEFTKAINAFWSPLISIFLVPFVILDIDRIIAFKILNILIGGALFPTIWQFTSAIGLQDRHKRLILFILIPFITSAVFLNTTPDVLVVLVLTLYITRVLSFSDQRPVKDGIIIGLVGTIGYLSKYYLFPFFIR